MEECLGEETEREEEKKMERKWEQKRVYNNFQSRSSIAGGVAVAIGRDSGLAH